MLAGRVISSNGNVTETDEPFQQYFCDFKENDSFVEKFLLIKEVENELKRQNLKYYVHFVGQKAIFWCPNKCEEVEVLKLRLIAMH